MKTPFFTPDDFQLVPVNQFTAAKIANEKFDKMIADAAVVYSRADDKISVWWPSDPGYDISVKARIVFIEEIKPKCEKHEPYQLDSQISAPHHNWFCFKCNAPLEPTWSAK